MTCYDHLLTVMVMMVVMMMTFLSDSSRIFFHFFSVFVALQARRFSLHPTWNRTKGLTGRLSKTTARRFQTTISCDVGSASTVHLKLHLHFSWLVIPSRQRRTETRAESDQLTQSARIPTNTEAQNGQKYLHNAIYMLIRYKVALQK